MTTRLHSTPSQPVNDINKWLSNIPIPDGPDRVNTTHMERLMCFQTGFLPFSRHHDAATTGFFTTPLQRAGAFLPLKTDHQHYQEHLEPGDEDYVKAPALYELLTNHAKPIEVSSVVYDKPIAIVYNPVSGTQQDVREKILNTLEKHAIAAEIFETKYYLHAWDLAEKELVLAKYSAIAVVGGDGLFHEVVNGLMKRKQKNESIPPLAFLPNGTGNDTVANFGVQNLDQALDFLIQGDTIKMDCNLLTLDANSSSEVPHEEWRDRARYSIGSSAVGFIAHVNKKATSLKRFIGGLAYALTGLKELLLNFGPHPVYDLEIEQPSGFKIHVSIKTLMLFINNGKYAGGHVNFTPAAILNDGLLDIIYKEGSFNVLTGIKFLDQAKNPQLEGGEVFRDDTTCLRAKSVVVHCDGSADAEPHLLQIDGENLEFKHLVKVEAVPDAIEIIVDARTVLAPMLPPRFLPLCEFHHR
jgi:diacylglycerol kinase family enzyme